MGPSLIPEHSLSSQESSRARPELQRESDRLKLLLDMTNTMVSNLEPRDLLRAISVSIRKDMHCDVVGVWLPDRERRQLRQLVMDFPESKGIVKEGMLLPMEGTEIGAVFNAGKPIVLRTKADVTSEPSIQVVRAEAIESGCILPLISRNRTLGCLTVASRIENSFSREDVDFLVRVAGQVAIAIENALAYKEIAELKDKLAQEKLYLEEEIRSTSDFEGIIGQSSALRKALQLVETVATSDSTVLLLGETGTGKELIARAIHERSRRKDRTFVTLNCAAIPTGLLESELFGHERGAFTGAVTQKIGRLELADLGTLLLDEVGDIPLELQPKLLRVLQDGEFERLGSTRTKKVDVRLITATNRDLDRMIEDRAISKRPLLPPECFSHPSASLARASRGHSLAGAILQPEVRAPHAKANRKYSCGGHAETGALALARKRSRTSESCGTRRDLDAQQYAGDLGTGVGKQGRGHGSGKRPKLR